MLRILSVLLLVLSGVMAQKLSGQDIYFIAAGISDYPGDGNDLVLPAKDAKAMYNLYKKNSMATSVLLTDSTATRNRILGRMKQVFGKAMRRDIVVFFFSGHGYPGGFCAYDYSVSYEDIREAFSSCRAKNKMIFADACFSGDIRERKETGHYDRKHNILLFLSCRSGEVSMESPEMRNGYFTACLLRSLKGGADLDSNRIITAEELYKAVSSRVKELSGDRQHPVMWGNFNDNLPVMVWK